MTNRCHVSIATSNALRLSSKGLQRPQLRLIQMSETNLSQEHDLPEERGTIKLVETLQVMLQAESDFLETLRKHTRERLEHKKTQSSDILDVVNDLNHENIIHLARFFFLLKALDCSTPKAVEALIDSHNDRIRKLIEAKNFEIRKEKELRKAFFSDQQKYICVKTIEAKPRVSFSKAEIASFLFDHMSRDSAIKGLDQLVNAGILNEEDSDPLTGTNRKLIWTDGFIEEAVAKCLDDVRFGVLGEEAP
jgi:hypothetical protein